MNDLLKRKKIRLDGYDYSSNGAYLVTVCVDNRHCLLWKNVGADIIRPNETMPLSEYGKIIESAIQQIDQHYENIVVDKYCIMPDHVHLIVFIMPEEDGRMISAPTLSVVIGSMKRWASKQIGFSIWQKSFNDRIIRNENGYKEAWRYIDENSLTLREKWFCENDGH